MSRSPSEVSIITVNWNGRSHLEALLPSLAELGAREIIVVDNASSDGSLEFLARQHPGVKVIQNPVNQGFAGPCNQGARLAQGRYVAFINNDMRADPGWLRAALAALSETAWCAASRILNWEGTRIDFNGSSLQYLGYALQKDIGLPLDKAGGRQRVLFACGGAMLAEREPFLRIGGFDEDYFAIFEDVDFGWRVWLSGGEVAFAPESVAYHRGHATFQKIPSPRTRYLMHRNALLTVLKNYGEEDFKRIFPIAVAMGIKRAVRLSGIRKEFFYLWNSTEDRPADLDAEQVARILDAVNHLAALDDVLSELPRLLEKRAGVQALRKRPDEEIFTYFEEPLRAIVEDPSYIESELAWLECLDVSSIFNPDGYRRHLENLSPRVREMILEYRELERRLLTNPSGSSHNPKQSGLGKFLRIWKTSGFAVAWNQLLKYVNRGT